MKNESKNLDQWVNNTNFQQMLLNKEKKFTKIRKRSSRLSSRSWSIELIYTDIVLIYIFFSICVLYLEIWYIIYSFWIFLMYGIIVKRTNGVIMNSRIFSKCIYFEIIFSWFLFLQFIRVSNKWDAYNSKCKSEILTL